MKRISLKQSIVVLGLLGAGLLPATSDAQNQNLAAEKIHDITGKEKRGYLGNVVVDESRKQIDLVFVTKSTNKKINFTAYQFDFDLNFLDEVKDEQEVSNAGSKYSWFKFRGENYSVVGVTAEPNMSGKLVVAKKETSFNWNWYRGGYKKKTKTLDKVKFTAPSGRKLTYRGHYNIDENGEVIILAGQPDKYFQEKSYSLLRIGPDLEVKSDVTVDMLYPQCINYSGMLSDGSSDEGESKDWIVVMTAAGGKQVYKSNKNSDPNMKNTTYLRISPDGKIKERINFDAKSLNWQIIGAYEKNGAVYLYGPGDSKGVGEKYQDLIMIPSAKYDNFQLVKISGGKTDFVSAPNLDEFKTKTKKPADQKNLSIYNGRKVVIGGITVTNSGDVFVNAQDYGTATNGGATVYKDLFMFHFTSSGELNASYGIESTQKKGSIAGGTLTDARLYPTDGDIYESPDGKSLYWMLFPVKQVYTHTETSGNVQTTTYVPLLVPRLGKIDIASGEADSFSEFGDGKFFLFNDHKFVLINGGKQVVFLGSGGEKGKQIWLGKFDPAKL